MPFFKKVYVAVSKIHGRGIFAGENIPRGAVIYVQGDETVYSKDEFEGLPESKKNEIRHFGYFWREDGNWHVAKEDIRYCNHSKKPNITENGDEIVAARDVLKGEELVQDYSEFEDGWD